MIPMAAASASSNTTPRATGGTITTYTSGNNVYRVHTFTSDGTFTFDKIGTHDVLVVGGGGQGGAARGINGQQDFTGAGGGAGGRWYGTRTHSVGNRLYYSVYVGQARGGFVWDGYTGYNSDAYRYYNGSQDVTYTGYGGGGGAGSNSGGAGSGGCGGGAGNTGSGGSAYQGYAGNNTLASGYGGGGGGGMSSAGAQGGWSAGGNGGNGLSDTITGTSVTRCGGGAGAGWYNGDGGAGGSGGGGGGGGPNYYPGDAGGNGQGGGGGGAYSPAGTDYVFGGNGGSGIVIFSYIVNTTV